MRSFLLTSLVAASLGALSHAQHNFVRPAMPALKVSQPSTQTLQIPIDHSNSNSKTFSNRFWVNSTYYKSGGPVFYMDVGEQTATDDFIQSYLMEAFVPTAVMQLAAKYSGLAVMMEHRYYGESLPYPINETTGLAPAGYEAYQYHTVEQALEDVVYLAEHFQPTGLDSSWSALAPTQAPWIFLGGSYPGARAAWIRIRSPDVIYASWASSAPVQTTVDMSTYYEQIYSDMTANCSADLAAASSYVTQVLTSGSAKDQATVIALTSLAQQPSLISKYSGLSDSTYEKTFAVDDQTDFSVGFSLANFIGSSFQSYGFSAALLPYCNLVEQFDGTEINNSSISNVLKTTFNNPYDVRSTPQGINAHYGPKAAFLAIVFGLYQQALAASDSTTQPDPHVVADGLSWTWQTCTEFGYFQVANTSATKNLLSTFINVTSWQQEECDLPFPYPQLPSSPNVQALVSKYGGWNMNPSQVMFTDGLLDPWHTLSVQSTSSEINAPNRKSTQTVPDCGKSADGTNVFGVTYPNGYHVSDLAGIEAEAVDGLALFEQALDKWIPCFQKHSITSSNTTSNTTPSNSGSGSGTASASPSKTGGVGGLADARNVQLGAVVALLAIMLLV